MSCVGLFGNVFLKKKYVFIIKVIYVRRKGKMGNYYLLFFFFILLKFD